MDAAIRREAHYVRLDVRADSPPGIFSLKKQFRVELVKQHKGLEKAALRHVSVALAPRPWTQAY